MKRLVWFIVWSSVALCGEYTTLPEFVTYVQSMPAHVANDSSDWSNPDYSSFHRSHIPTFFDRIKHFFGLGSYDPFPIKAFQEKLRQVTKMREKSYGRGRLIQKIVPDPKSSFIIWSEINGSLHSLVRSLQELKVMGVIDDDLRIVQQKTYLVFNGDVVTRSAFIVETLFLVLELMLKNPQHVIYIKGRSEDKQAWVDGQFARELVIKARELSREKVPLANDILRFFGTLPLALYLIPPEQEHNKKKRVVRISFFDTNFADLDEGEFAYFFDPYTRPVVSLTEKIASEYEAPTIAAYIFAEDRTRKYTDSQGLILASKNEQGARWEAFSGLTPSSQRLYQFFNDAFVVLTTAKRLFDWKVTLHYQDAQFLDGFKQTLPFSLVSGEKIEQEKQTEIIRLQDKLASLLQDNQLLESRCLAATTDDESVVTNGARALQDGNLVVGSTMDLSKQLQEYSKLLQQGLNLVITEANKEQVLEGGLKIRMIYLDDGYDPKRSRKNVETFLNKFKTDIMLGSMGAPTLGGYIDVLKQDDIAVFFPNTGSFRASDIKNLVHLRVSYYDAGRTVTQYVLEKNPTAQKFAFFYQDDEWGRDLLNGGRFSLEHAGIHEILAVPYKRNAPGSFSSAAKEIEDFKPDAIGLFGAPRFVKDLLQDMRDANGRRILFGDTSLGEKSFLKFLKDKGLNITIAQVVPNPKHSKLEIAKEFRKHAKAEGVPIDVVSFEGYITARVFLDVLKKMPPNFTKEQLIEAVEQIKDYDFKGLKLNFNPQNRQLLHTVWMNDEGDSKDWVPQEVVPLVNGAQKPGQTGEPQDEKKEVEEVPEVEAAPPRVSPVKEDEQPLLSMHGNIFELGSTMDLSKGVKSLSESYKSGIRLKIDEIESKGGLNGIQFKYDAFDDEYEPSLARKNVEKLLESGIDVLLAPVGTPTFKSYVDLVESGKVLALFPSTGSSAFRRPDLINVIHYRPSLATEGGVILRYMIDEHNLNRIAMFYQDDYFGQEPTTEMKRILKEEYNNEDYIALPYTRNDVNFKEQVEKIKAFDPDAIAFAGTSTAVQGFIRQIGVNFLFGKQLFGVSWVMDKALLDFLKLKGLGINLVSVVPDPVTSETQLAQEFRKLAKERDVAMSPASLEGFLYMSLFEHALSQLERPFSKAKIINWFQDLNNFDFKGIKLTFDPETREIPEYIWIYTGEGKPWVQKPVRTAAPKDKEAKEPAEKEIPAEAEEKDKEQEVPTEIVKEDKEKDVVTTEDEKKEVEEVPEVEAAPPRVSPVKEDEQPLLSMHGNIFELGSTMDLSKGVKSLSESYKSGIRLKIDQIESKGGLNGIQFKYDAFDDEYEPSLARKNVEKLLESGIDVLLAPVGTPTFKSYVDLVESGKVLALFPSTGSSAFRRPDLINVIHYRPSLATEGGVILRYMIDEHNLNRIAMFYQDDYFGQEPTTEMKRILKEEYNNEDYIALPYTRNDVNFKEQVEKIKAFDPDAIAFAGTSTAVQGFIRQIGVNFLFGKQLFGVSWVMDKALLDFLKLKGLGINLVSVVPDPETSETQLAQEFRKLARERDIAMSPASLEGFLYMSLFEHALSQLERPFSKAKIINWFQDLNNFDFKGIKLTFDPETREIPEYIWIYTGEGKPWVQKLVRTAPKEGKNKKNG